MNIERLDSKAVKKISGPSWDSIRDLFATINDKLLSVSENVSGELTTIYIKYSSTDTAGLPFSVVWIKKASEIVVGLSLPDHVVSSRLVGPPKGCKYAGLTKFFVVDELNSPPEELEQWANEAYQFRKQMQSI